MQTLHHHTGACSCVLYVCAHDMHNMYVSVCVHIWYYSIIASLILCCVDMHGNMMQVRKINPVVCLHGPHFS